MSKDRIKYQGLKNVLPKYLKEEYIISMKQQIDALSCIYYYYYILKGYTYFDYYYGHQTSGEFKYLNEIMNIAIKDLKLNNKVEGAFEKVKLMNKSMKKPSVSFIKSIAPSMMEHINILENNVFGGTFAQYSTSVIKLSYVYGGSITPKRLSDLGAVFGIDVGKELFSQIERFNSQYKILSKMLSTARNRVKTDGLTFFYRGKVYNKNNSGRISKNFKKSIEMTDSFKDNLSAYLYLYEDVLDVPIIIDGNIQMDREMGYSQGGDSVKYFTVKSNRIIVNDRRFRFNHVSISDDFVKRASVTSIYHTLVHELTHSWQFHAELVHPKRYKSFMNGWTRYFNELSRIGMFGVIGNPNSSNIARQQKEDFLDGLSDFIKIKKLKNGYKVHFLQSNMKPMFFPTIDSLCATMIQFLTPSNYGMSHPYELMAEVISMLALGQSSPLGINLDSDVATFYNPMARFIKLADRHGFNRA
jgi:hypothetical protein